MKYLPTIQLWDTHAQQALRYGQLKLQVGQWCRCGQNEKPCRYVGHTKHSINVVHWQGSAKATNDLFLARIGKA